MTVRSPGPRLPPGTKLLERLTQEAIIDPDDQQRAILHAQRIDGRCEDALIEIGAMSETDLLKYLANVYKTRFVTTEKLSKASIADNVLALVPRKVAERMLVFPILYDAGRQALSVVAGAPGEHDVVKQVQLVSTAREVHVYIARPATVSALIAKHYDGDRGAFSELAARYPSVARTLGTQTTPYAGADYYDDSMPPGANRESRPATGELPIAPSARAGAMGERDQMLGGGEDMQILPRRKRLLKIEAPDVRPTQQQVDTIIRDDSPQAAPKAAPRIQTPPAGSVVVSTTDFLGTLNVLVALHEQGRAELRGHSAQVARLCRKLAERMGLDEARSFAIQVAAQIHDIGKGSSYHLTALNVAQYEGHKIQAQKTFMTPLRFFESVKLPKDVEGTLAHLYERADGTGFPDKLSGKDTPLGARMLAVVETYCDLTSHAKNPFRKVLEPKEACAALARQRDQIFDGTILDLLALVALGDDLKAKLLSDRPTILLCDPDAEETTVLELRLVENGFEVLIARTATDAYERVQKRGIDAVVAEVDITPIDGFELLARLKQSGPGKDLPVLFLTRRADRDSVDRGFELGAADFLVKPASGDVVAAKARQVIAAGQRRGAGRGVSGSLTEMALPDVLQILSNGRKSGKLEIAAGGRKGDILFSDGAIWGARFAERNGVEAVYAMLLLDEGDFTLDPSARATERTVHDSTESILLEGMRRLDEGRR